MAKPVYPSDKQDQYMVRFPDGMRDRLKAEAERNNRSMNAEIVKRLEEAFEFEGALTGRDAEEREWGESIREMLMRHERERQTDRKTMAKIVRNQNRVGKVLAKRLAEHDPSGAKLLGSFFAADEDDPGGDD